MVASVLSSFAADEGSGLPIGTQVTELPRPNSGTYTFEQAAARKDEILSNTPSKRLNAYKRPYMGFSVHVEADDSFTVYAPIPDIQGADFPRKKQTVEQIMALEAATPRLGNPHGVLITSERPLKESKTIQALLKLLHVPSIQIFYLTQKTP
jgi:hypothetical protein